MSSLDGTDSTVQELALMCVCKMASQLDAGFAQEVVDSGGIPHLIMAMFSSNAQLAQDAREALRNIHEKLPAFKTTSTAASAAA
jgi:hypothetical protein